MLFLPIVTFAVLVALFIADFKPDPPKSAEKELGDAIAKYLSNGVKVKIIEDKKN